MLKRLVVVAALVTTFGAVTPSAGSAQSLFFDNYCVTSFNVCASVRVFAAGNNLRMQIWNLNGVQGVQHTMTSVGLYHLGAADDWTGTIQSFSATWVTGTGTQDVSQYWRPKWSTDIKTLAAENIDLAEGTSGTRGGIVGCTDPGGQIHFSTCLSFPGSPYLEFNFTLSSAFDMTNLGLRWHSQQLPGGNSAKCDTGTLTSYGPCQGANVVPEPVTIALLGTGLAGLGGIGLIRRRRRREEAGG